MSPDKTNAIHNTCECNERVETKIDSCSLFEEINAFFKENVMAGVYSDIPVIEPYYIGKGQNGYELEWYADKWYKCNVCGCLWEFNYPDFPAVGFVKKFKDGKHVRSN